jgi:hypothetical protein
VACGYRMLQRDSFVTSEQPAIECGCLWLRSWLKASSVWIWLLQPCSWVSPVVCKPEASEAKLYWVLQKEFLHDIRYEKSQETWEVIPLTISLV